MTEGWTAEALSPLGWAECSRCHAGRALVVESWAHRALCGVCLAAEHPVPASTEQPGPVVGWQIGGRSPEVVAEQSIHPRPEWTSRMELPEGWEHPAPVLSLARYAESLEWRTRVQYARGYGIHSKLGTPLALAHTVAVRIGGHPASDCVGYSLYSSPVARMAWTWKSHWVWGPYLPPHQLSNLTEMKDWLCDSVMSDIS